MNTAAVFCSMVRITEVFPNFDSPIWKHPHCTAFWYFCHGQIVHALHSLVDPALEACIPIEFVEDCPLPSLCCSQDDVNNKTDAKKAFGP